MNAYRLLLDCASAALFHGDLHAAVDALDCASSLHDRLVNDGRMVSQGDHGVYYLILDAARVASEVML